MKVIVRACGGAAAALALAASATYADPSYAEDLAAGANGPTYIAHAAATIAPAGATMDSDTQEAAASATDKMLRKMRSVVPGHYTLDDLVEAKAGADTPDSEQECLARAVYFEARGESLEGQLAVADVVLNRVASKRYPDTICAVVVQRAQFSFIRDGRFPPVDRSTKAWRKAVAVAEIAREELAEKVAEDVLWYHADYVAPIWRHGLDERTRIGVHIFYS